MYVADGPDPSALVREELGVGIESQVTVSGAEAARELGGPVAGNEHAAADELVDHLGAVERDDFRAGAVAFLVEGGFCEAGEGDEVAGGREAVALFDEGTVFGVKGADKFIQVVSADGVGGRFAFGDGAAGFEAMVGFDVELAAGLVNVQAWLFEAERDKEVGHEAAEEVAAAVVVGFEDADGSRERHG